MARTKKEPTERKRYFVELRENATVDKTESFHSVNDTAACNRACKIAREHGYIEYTVKNDRGEILKLGYRG